MQEKIWKIQASYTVEASYIMSMVILSLAVLIRAALVNIWTRHPYF